MTKGRIIARITKRQHHPTQPGVYPVKLLDGWTAASFHGTKWRLFGDASQYEASELPIFEFGNRIMLPADE
jgi:hypothetical protein